MVAQRRQLRRRLNSGAYKLRCPRPSAAVFHSFPTPPLGIRDRQACHEEAHRQGADGDADTQAYLCPRREPVGWGHFLAQQPGETVAATRPEQEYASLGQGESPTQLGPRGQQRGWFARLM
ncbi:hypothetical protein UVI_02034120 [Ustilaginoidea virens]|uniref:Uncharacterized protein n=1 Tax=Ustilaginoidea virens TaxID=1159556 RepID=A0A1B5KTS8_USTVR|nr:hypothetical protein UVI_02034120 [Ustilaginoidea virens]